MRVVVRHELSGDRELSYRMLSPRL
jgi:hypothetical protein